jgi:hypothetical protein
LQFPFIIVEPLQVLPHQNEGGRVIFLDQADAGLDLTNIAVAIGWNGHHHFVPTKK